MNAARAGRSVAGLAARRAGACTPRQPLPVSRQVANKTSSTKGTVAHETVTPPTGIKQPVSVAHETVTPPLAKKEVAHETLTPPLAGKGAAKAAPPPAKRSGNLMIGAVLVGAVAASYYVTIHKMKDQDFLGEAEKEAAEEAQVNLHKSGLKVSSKVVPEKVEQALTSVQDAVSEAAKKAGAVAENVKSGAGTMAEKAKSGAGAVAERAKSAVSGKDEAAEAAAAEAAAAAAEAAKPKKKGWRKYIIFGPRREG